MNSPWSLQEFVISNIDRNSLGLNQLCIDIGNTRIKIAVFSKEEMIHHEVFFRKSEKEVAQLIKAYKIKKAISSSTRKSFSTFEKRVAKHVNLMRLTHLTPTPVENEYETPETLGKDRLAAVVACTQLYPKKNCLVIDAGTCITYDFITKKGIYKGGNISPGLRMRAEAMDTFTSALPLVEPIHHEDFLGKSTSMAMENGVVYGTLLEIQSFITLIKEKYGAITIVLTGGDAPFFAEVLNSKIFVHSFLVLEGLNTILNYNAA